MVFDKIIYEILNMKVAIDSGPLSGGHSVRGVGVYTRILLETLSPLASRKGITIDQFDFQENLVKLKNYDVIHYPFFDLFFDTLPYDKPTKSVVTIHDVTPLVYPKHYPPGIKGSWRFFKQKRSLQTISAVITDTEASKKDIVRFLNVRADKIFPIHLAPGKSYRKLKHGSWKKETQTKYKLPTKFALFVGDVNYNKNIPNLIEACNRSNIPLFIVGKHAKDIEGMEYSLKNLKGPMDWMRYLLGKNHPELAHQKQLLEILNKSDNVSRLGFVANDDLSMIYNLATFYCQASFYEGFGIPPLEAQACGCPVVSSRTQALSEILDESALFFDPNDISDMAEKLKLMFNDKSKQKEYIEKGEENVKRFSWRETAQKTLEVYRQVA